jgi:hypothetical protein
VCDLDATGTPSIFKIIRSAATLAKILSNFDFTWEEGASGGSGNIKEKAFGGLLL